MAKSRDLIASADRAEATRRRLVARDRAGYDRLRRDVEGATGAEWERRMLVFRASDAKRRMDQLFDRELRIMIAFGDLACTRRRDRP